MVDESLRLPCIELTCCIDMPCALSYRRPYALNKHALYERVHIRTQKYYRHPPLRAVGDLHPLGGGVMLRHDESWGRAASFPHKAASFGHVVRRAALRMGRGKDLPPLPGAVGTCPSVTLRLPCWAI